MQDQKNIHSRLPFNGIHITLVLVLSALVVVGLFWTTPVAAQGGTVVRFDPASTTIGVGNTTVVNLRIDNVTNLAGAEAHITFNAAIIDVLSIEAGGLPAPDFVAQSIIGNGKIDYAIAQMPQQHPPANGSGVFIKITVKGKAAGTSPLTLVSVVLADSSANSIPATLQNGAVTVGQSQAPTATPTNTAPAQATFTPTATSATTPTSTATTAAGTPTLTPTAPGAGQGAVLRVVPRQGNLAVTIQNASNLWALDLKLTFDQVIAQCTGSTPGQMPKPDIVARNTCTANALQYTVTQKLGTAPANGNGDVVQFTLACRQTGATSLHFESAKLTDNNGMSLPVSTVDGEFDCGPAATATPTATFTPTRPVSGAILKVIPSWGLIYNNNLGVLKLGIENASNLWAIDLTLSYNPAIAQCVASVPGFIPMPDIVARSICSGNRFLYTVSQKAPRNPSNGSGDVAYLTFRCIQSGTTDLVLSNVKLSDRDGRMLSVQTINGKLTCDVPNKPTFTPTPTPIIGNLLGWHTVRGCETLFCIARAYRVSPWAIAAVNHIPYPYWVYTGQRLAIPNVPWPNPFYGPVCQRQFGVGAPPPPPPPPPPGPGCRAMYYVSYGDTLSAIAWRFRTTVGAIVAANHLPSANWIWAGQRLCIP